MPACGPFTPSKSGQRSPPTYYRGCWHVVSRGLLSGYHQAHKMGCFFPATVVYDLKGLHPHAALLRQTFVHCAIFLTAASRRSLGRVSVPVWLIILSDQLLIVALVSRYLTNKLIRRMLLFCRRNFNNCHHAVPLHHRVLAPRWKCYPRTKGRLHTCYSPVRHYTYILLHKHR